VDAIVKRMTEEEYIKQATKFASGETRFSLQPFPCLDDNSGHGFDQHYIYHVAWALKKIREINPKSHTDISSSLHLSTCASAFYPTTYLDYRKPDLQLENLTVGEIDLAAQSIEPVECLSCCHVVEHIGLGRYGDKIDNTGDLKAIENLKLSAASHLLFVVPVGIPTVMFNAHRVYSPVYIRNLFPEFDCEFYLIPNTRDYPYIAEIVELDIPYGCGCFYFRRKINGCK
jgi:hypothetical protein